MNSQHSSHNRIARRMICAALALLLCAQFPAMMPRAAAVANAHASPGASKARAQESYGKLPIQFEVNRGQFDARVKFVSRQRGFSLALTPDEAVIGPVRMRMIGANQQAHISGQGPLPGKTHYFLGNDPKQWRTDVPTFARVKYETVYQGVDLIFYGKGKQLEYDFVVAPGADPNAIKLSFAGARRVRLDANGDLILKTKDGEMRQHKPVVYQEVNGVRQQIEANYRLIELPASRSIRNPQSAIRNQAAFALGAYDRSQPLVIDPVLSYSTFLGGNESDVGNAIAVDAEGNTYVTGNTGFFPEMRNPFPTTPGAYKSGGDLAESRYVFVTKMNPQGSALVYSAIIGGTQSITFNPTPNQTQYLLANEGTGIAVDASGNAYVTGWTVSANFPTTPGALQSQRLALRDGQETFAFKLNTQGSALTFSTLVGNGNTLSKAIAVDAQGQAWITGNTQNRAFPTTADAFQKTIRNGGNSAFVVKLNATGTAMLYSTYLSSGSGETGHGIVVDADGNAYVGGTTGSSCAGYGRLAVEPFPTTPGAFRRDLGEGCTGPGSSAFTFAVKFKPDGAVVYSTLLGVSYGGSIAVDAQGNAYLAGGLNKIKLHAFPVTPGAFQTTIEGPDDTPANFVAKLNPTGSALVYSTLLNGAAGNYGGFSYLAVDKDCSAYVTGGVSSSAFVATTKAPPFEAGQGVFVLKLNPAGSGLDYSVVLGDGTVSSIVLDARGDACIAGYTNGDNFPTTAGAFQRQRRNAAPYLTDAFVARISERAEVRTASHVSAANYAAPLAADSIIAAFGSGLAMATEAASLNPLPTALVGTTVKVRDSAGAERDAPLFFVSPTQINYLMPAGTASGAATINIASGDGTVSTASVQIEPVAPGLFTADASGRGLAAAVALRVKANGEQSYEPIAQYDTALNRMMPMPVNLASETEQVFLILYGTGLRHRGGLGGVSAKIGGIDAQALYAGAQGDCLSG
ncbi:MAG: SBBP repeat-containing protein, partial [Acidobacteriota bacterium]